MPKESETDYAITDLYLHRKRNSSLVLENNLPKKMGKQNIKNNSFRKKSAENILRDIKDVKQKWKESNVVEVTEGHVSWHTETTICPPADLAIPQRTLERYIRFLSNDYQNAEKLNYWKIQYEEAIPDETVQMLGSFEELALCPVCQEELPKSKIEAHADECAAKMFKN